MTLPPEAIQLFAQAIARQAAAAAEPRDYCRDLISRANLPERWKPGANANIGADAIVSARRLIEWADAKGINSEDPRYTTVGSVIAVLLDDAGPDVRDTLAPTILEHNLILNRDLANALREHCPTGADLFVTQRPPADVLAITGNGRPVRGMTDVERIVVVHHFVEATLQFTGQKIFNDVVGMITVDDWHAGVARSLWTGDAYDSALLLIKWAEQQGGDILARLLQTIVDCAPVRDDSDEIRRIRRACTTSAAHDQIRG